MDFGATASLNPFQCALVNDAILPSAERQKIIDASLEKLCRNIIPLEAAVTDFDEEEVANKVMFKLLSSDVTYAPSITVNDSLRFIADIELLSNQSPPQQLSIAQSPRNSLPSVMASATRSKPPECPTVPTPPKRNPFMTAKEKYGAEVLMFIFYRIYMSLGG